MSYRSRGLRGRGGPLRWRGRRFLPKTNGSSAVRVVLVRVVLVGFELLALSVYILQPLTPGLSIDEVEVPLPPHLASTYELRTYDDKAPNWFDQLTS